MASQPKAVAEERERTKCDDACYKSGKGCILSATGVCLHLNFVAKNYSNKDYYKKPKEYKENVQSIKN